jgi:hypothetical protein
MPPHPGQPLSMTLDLARLGWECWMDMGLRAAKLAAGGPTAILEAQRMTTEKTAAMLEAQAAAAMALATGSSPRAATRKAVAPYRRRVKPIVGGWSIKSKWRPLPAEGETSPHGGFATRRQFCYERFRHSDSYLYSGAALG